jgi:tRNA threonylcarbamoyladenosine biosynthesis protein TsaB
MAAAKGFCYILKIPLILVNTLELMAFSAIKATPANDQLYCPMIDARRMEVFTCLYDGKLSALWPAAAVVLDENFDARFPSGKKVLVFGNGSKKYRGSAMMMDNITTDASHLAELSSLRFDSGDFTMPESAVPFYGKAFYTPPVK